MESDNKIQFAIENPASSEVWRLQETTDAMERNVDRWKLVQVDQCAYGRRSQKPTRILTNLRRWIPAGSTGNGKCIIGKCAGTRTNAPGDRRHEEQTVPNSKARRPKQGEKNKHRWDYTREAVVNPVAEDLIKEIIGAAIEGKEESTTK